MCKSHDMNDLVTEIVISRPPISRGQTSLPSFTVCSVVLPALSIGALRVLAPRRSLQIAMPDFSSSQLYRRAVDSQSSMGDVVNRHMLPACPFLFVYI